jgi:hypothetical protein
MNNNTRFSTGFVTMLIVLSILSIKMAFLYGAELLLFLLITVPMVISILLLKNVQRNNDEKNRPK